MEPFVGQITPFACNFAPRNWATCQGQLLPIQQNTALFSLLGTYYGGNGTSTFALPDMQGRVPVHQGQLAGGNSYLLGEPGGDTNVVLGISTMRAHNHPFNAPTDKATVATSSGNVLGKAQKGAAQTGISKGLIYAPNAAPATTMAPNALQPSGQTLPHNNMQPYLTLNYCVALTGIFPARN